MEIVDISTFFRWADPHGIGLSREYPDSKTLVHNNSPDTWARWTVEKDASAAYALSAVLRLLGNWESCWLYHKYGTWNFDYKDTYDAFYEMLGHYFDLHQIPRVFEGVLKVRRDEVSGLLLFSFLQLLYPGSAATDVYLISGDGKYIILLGHHDEIIVSCASSQVLDEFIMAMEEKGFPVD